MSALGSAGGATEEQSSWSANIKDLELPPVVQVQPAVQPAATRNVTLGVSPNLASPKRVIPATATPREAAREGDGSGDGLLLVSSPQGLSTSSSAFAALASGANVGPRDPAAAAAAAASPFFEAALISSG